MFTFDQNQCSPSIGVGVHVQPEWVFIFAGIRNLTKAMAENAEEYHIRALENEDFEPLAELAEFQALIPPIEEDDAKTEED